MLDTRLLRGEQERDGWKRPRKGLSSPIRHCLLSWRPVYVLTSPFCFCPHLGALSPLGECDRLGLKMKAWSCCVNINSCAMFLPNGSEHPLFSLAFHQKHFFFHWKQQSSLSLWTLQCAYNRVLRVDRVRRLGSPCPQVPQGALASCIIALTTPNFSFSVSIHGCPHYWIVSSSKPGLCCTHFLRPQWDLLNGFPF